MGDEKATINSHTPNKADCLSKPNAFQQQEVTYKAKYDFYTQKEYSTVSLCTSMEMLSLKIISNNAPSILISITRAGVLEIMNETLRMQNDANRTV